MIPSGRYWEASLTACSVGADGELRQLLRPGDRRQSRDPQSKGSLYVTRPSLQGYITTREELTEASNELFSLIASGVIKVDVAESQNMR